LEILKLDQKVINSLFDYTYTFPPQTHSYQKVNVRENIEKRFVSPTHNIIALKFF